MDGGFPRPGGAATRRDAAIADQATACRQAGSAGCRHHGRSPRSCAARKHGGNSSMRQLIRRNSGSRRRTFPGCRFCPTERMALSARRSLRRPTSSRQGDEDAADIAPAGCCDRPNYRSILPRADVIDELRAKTAVGVAASRKVADARVEGCPNSGGGVEVRARCSKAHAVNANIIGRSP